LSSFSYSEFTSSALLIITLFDEKSLKICIDSWIIKEFLLKYSFSENWIKLEAFLSHENVSIDNLFIILKVFLFYLISYFPSSVLAI
jgi:hypothetical protein